MLKSAIGLILINVFLPIIFVFTSKLFPAKKTPSPNELIELEKKFKKWERLNLLFIIAYCIGLCFIWFNFLKFFVKMYYTSKSDSFLVIGFEKAFLFVPSLFLAIFSSVILLNFTYRIILKKNYDDFIVYLDSKSQMDGRKVVAILASCLVPICITLVTLGTDYYIRFTPGSIYRNDFLSFTEIKYEYKYISRITKKSCQKDIKGNIIYGWPFYIIEFKDGYQLWIMHKSISSKDFEKHYLKKILIYSGIKRIEMKS